MTNIHLLLAIHIKVCYSAYYYDRKIRMKLKTKFVIMFVAFAIISIVDGVFIFRIVGNIEKLGVLINVSGAQRMLCQKMSKEVMLIASQLDVIENKTNLAGTRTKFDTTLSDLMSGNEDKGLLPPPNVETINQLQVVAEIWEDFSIHIDTILSDEFLNADSIKYIYDHNLTLLAEMNTAVGLYEKASNINKITITKTITVGVTLLIIVIYFIMFNSSILKPIMNQTLNIDEASGFLEKASRGISESSADLSKGTTSIASSVEEMTASMEELQSIIESNTRNINESKMLMQDTLSGTQSATLKLNELEKAMSEINSNSKLIEKIIHVIDDIAFQTNILALNASVEAARAGKAGRGFTVVATQVKELAEKSADAAKETSNLIDKAIHSVNTGLNIQRDVLETQNNAEQLAKKVGDLLIDINQSSVEQLKGVNQVTEGITQINRVVQSTVTTAEQTSASSDKLLEQSHQLSSIVLQFNRIVYGTQPEETSSPLYLTDQSSSVHKQR